MKRALRNTDTSLFIKSDLGETGLIEQACCFDNYQEAFDFCNQNQLNRVELVVRMSEQYEFIIDVPSLAGATDESPSSAATSHQAGPDAVDLCTSQA